MRWMVLVAVVGCAPGGPPDSADSGDTGEPLVSIRIVSPENEAAFSLAEDGTVTMTVEVDVRGVSLAEATGERVEGEALWLVQPMGVYQYPAATEALEFTTNAFQNEPAPFLQVELFDGAFNSLAHAYPNCACTDSIALVID